MGYFNYHAKIRKLIKEGQVTKYEFVSDWNGIKPALVIYFKNEKPMPIREYRWQEYIDLLENQEI